MEPTVDITLSVHDGGRWLPDQIRSLQAQTHERWRLWIRDDGSTDDSHALASRFEAEDPRIHVHPRDGRRLGRPLAQGWLLEHLPGDASRVFTCDADDVWMPHKVALTLGALAEAERKHPGSTGPAGSPAPVLVHTDLEVVDAELRLVAPSFWAYTGVAPEPASLARVAVANVATGPTVLVNRALLDLALPVPAASPDHDWWLTLVAAAFGTVVAVPEPTVRYRRHGANVTGALTGPLRGPGDAARRLAGAAQGTDSLRRWVRRTADQAAAFLERFDADLTVEEARRLRDLASVPGRSFLGRKLGVMRHHALPERGLVRNLGLILRA